MARCSAIQLLLTPVLVCSSMASYRLRGSVSLGEANREPFEGMGRQSKRMAVLFSDPQLLLFTMVPSGFGDPVAVGKWTSLDFTF